MKVSKNIKKMGQSAEKAGTKLKSEIQRHLKDGKIKLNWLETQINSDENRAKIEDKMKNAKEQINHLKETFIHFEKKAVHYTEKNPKKALAIATTAGILAASLWHSFQTSEKAPAAKTAKTKTPVKNKKVLVAAKSK
ncbi:MAG TPA: hypothetical protein VK791_11865 [bacterium]|jgi:ElaB/YqjD/DUF883 family membrane-anchored ribosome-binding protein|nr:hypothetical protein [bacterium]